MSLNQDRDERIPTKPLPDLVVKSSFAISLTIVLLFSAFIVLTGFSQVVALPKDIAGPPGPVTVAVGPQGASQTPDLSDQGATGPQGLLGSTLTAGPQGPKGDTGATGATGPTGPMGPTGPAGPPGINGGSTSPGEGVTSATCVSQLVITTPVDTSSPDQDVIKTMQITGDLSNCVGETLRARVALDSGSYVWAVYPITTSVTEVNLSFDELTGDFYDTKPTASNGGLVVEGLRVAPVSVGEFGRTTITIAKKWQ